MERRRKGLKPKKRVEMALKCPCGHVAVISKKVRAGRLSTFAGVCPACSEQYLITVERIPAARPLHILKTQEDKGND